MFIIEHPVHFRAVIGPGDDLLRRFAESGGIAQYLPCISVRKAAANHFCFCKKTAFPICRYSKKVYIFVITHE